jgi:hypothetical protein
VRRDDPRLQIITEAIERLIPGATPAFLTVEVTETLPGSSDHRNTWTGRPAGLAERVFTALYGRPGPGEQLSPLEQAEDAKRRRDLDGEIYALVQGHTALTSAPWYPARPGDLVHVHHEAGGTDPAFGETYLISPGAYDGSLTMRLLAHTLPVDTEFLDGMVGCFAVDDDPDPLMELWFEAGPHTLTIVRQGRVVHDGPARGRGQAATRILFEAERHAATMRDVRRYLEQEEPQLALARLRSGQPLPPCGAPGITTQETDCARPRGHRPPCSPDADYVAPPHECPALPEQLHAVLTVDAKCTHIHIAGVTPDRDNAIDHASGFAAFREDLTKQYVKPAPGLPGEVMLQLPLANERHVVGVQLAVVAPLRMLPDLRAEDEWAAEGAATALSADDYADDYDHEDG